MLVAITLIMVAMVTLAALEIWLSWQLGERDDRRHSEWQRPQPSEARSRLEGACPEQPESSPVKRAPSPRRRLRVKTRHHVRGRGSPSQP